MFHNKKKKPKPNVYPIVSLMVLYIIIFFSPLFRNDVWRYNRAVWGHSKPYRWVKTLFRGFPLGAACAAATIAFEEYYGVYKHHGHDDHGHGGEHGGHH